MNLDSSVARPVIPAHRAFAAFTGALADRFDIRRLIQIGMLLFMAVSICWSWMFYTDSVELWKAMILLVVHGVAGVIWIPASQVLINQLVAHQELPSAVRMTATGRYFGFVVGPSVGSGLLLLFGPTIGIGINAAIYAPLCIWLIKAPAGPATGFAAPQRAIGGMRDLRATIRVVATNPILGAMTVLAGAASFFVGNAYQAQMPGFAHDLGHGRADFSYSVLLAADAAGGLLGGLILESRNLLPPKSATAFALAMCWCATLGAFALCESYALCIALLAVAGFLELAFNSMAQSLVQLNAPAEIRGRVIGVFSTASMGLRLFSGLSVGLLGAVIGIHASLACSAGVLFTIYLAILLVSRKRVAA